MLGTLYHHASRALDNVRQSTGLNLLTVGTMAAALTLIGLYAVAMGNVQQLSQLWNRVGTVTLYLADGLEPEAWQRTAELLASDPAIASARAVTPDATLREFMALGAEARQMVAGLDPRIFPPAVEISLANPVDDASGQAVLEARLMRVPGVVGIDYGQDEHEQIAVVMQVVRWVGLAGGLLVVLAVIFIVSNTIKLIVYARRDEVEVIQLVGGTAGFIRAPFLIEGALWGLAGGVVASALLWVLDASVADALSASLAQYIWGFSLHLFAWWVAGLVVGLGLVLGLVGSLVAVGRFLE